MNLNQYSEAYQFLSDAQKLKQKNNPNFSVRFWAKEIGFSSHASLNLMLRGKRKIPKQCVPLFIKSLELSHDDGLYLETLIGFNQAKTLIEKELYGKRLHEISKNPPLNSIELESFRYLGDPIHCFILDMMDLPNFKMDPHWIKDRLKVQTTILQIQNAIQRLKLLGILVFDQNEDLVKVVKNITSKNDVTDLGVQEYHKNVCELSKILLPQIPINEREYVGNSMAISKSKIPKAKKIIRDFVKKFDRLLDAPVMENEEVYQLSIQFFPITNNIFSNEKENKKNKNYH